MSADTEPRIGTDEGDTCNRLGCLGTMNRWDIGWIDGPDPITCGICGHGPDNEMDDTNDD